MSQPELMKVRVELGDQVFDLDLATAPSYLHRVPLPITIWAQHQWKPRQLQANHAAEDRKHSHKVKGKHED